LLVLFEATSCSSHANVLEPLRLFTRNVFKAGSKYGDQTSKGEQLVGPMEEMVMWTAKMMKQIDIKLMKTRLQVMLILLLVRQNTAHINVSYAEHLSILLPSIIQTLPIDFRGGKSRGFVYNGLCGAVSQVRSVWPFACACGYLLSLSWPLGFTKAVSIIHSSFSNESGQRTSVVIIGSHLQLTAI
jgi:hypothetical protein